MGLQSLLIGIAIGLVIGFILKIKQKPWTELTQKEQKKLTLKIVVLSTTFLLGLTA